MAARLLLKNRPRREHDPDEDFRVAHTLKGKSGTVSIALKLPNGLLIRLYRFEESHEPILGGGFRTFKIAKPIESFNSGPGQYSLHGNRFPFGVAPKQLIIGGYGITPNVPEEFWKEWVKQNHDSDLLRNHLIFAYRSGDRLADDCREHRKTRSGLEPISINTDGTLDASDTRLRQFTKTKHLSGIQKADDKD